MVDSILKKLKNTLQQEIYPLMEKKEQISNDITEYVELNNKVQSFLKKYNETGYMDFSLLDKFESLLYELNILEKGIDYKELQEIKKEIEYNFPDKVTRINNIFMHLINKLNAFSNNYIREYKYKARQKFEVELSIDNINEILRIISKIEHDEIIYENDFLILDEMLQKLEEEERLKLYAYIVINNSDVIQKTIEKEKAKQAKERLNKIVKEKRTKRLVENKQQPSLGSQKEAVELEDIQEKPEIKTHKLNDEEKDLLQKAKCIIDENVTLDNELLQVMVGLNYYQILDYIDDTKDPQQSIAIILAKKIIPEIYDGTIENISEILDLYISKYNRIIEDKSIPNRLKKLGKLEILNTITTVEKMLQYYDEHKNDADIISAAGYYAILRNALMDIKYAIEDDDLFESDMIDELYKELLSAVNKVKNLGIKEDNGSNEMIELDESKETHDFYNNASNLIVFPDGIDFSKQINEDTALTFSHKRKVLKGLENLSKDNNILFSSRHKVKDDNNSSLYKKLRSYKGPDYRIIYRVSEAKGLEKLYGHKINIVFPIKVFYGASDNKEDEYNDAKRMYDIVIDDIENLIKVLNSDDNDLIVGIVEKQINEMQKYINSCDPSYDSSSSIGTIGGNKDE